MRTFALVDEAVITGADLLSEVGAQLLKALMEALADLSVGERLEMPQAEQARSALERSVQVLGR